MRQVLVRENIFRCCKFTVAFHTIFPEHRYFRLHHKKIQLHMLTRSCEAEHVCFGFAFYVPFLKSRTLSSLYPAAHWWLKCVHIDGLVQDCNIPSALSLEILQCSTNSSILPPTSLCNPIGSGDVIQNGRRDLMKSCSTTVASPMSLWLLWWLLTESSMSLVSLLLQC